MGKGINLKFSEGKSSSTFIKFKRNLKNAVAKSLGVQHGMKDLLEVEDFEKVSHCLCRLSTSLSPNSRSTARLETSCCSRETTSLRKHSGFSQDQTTTTWAW